MAPEVVDQSGATTSSDIWSLGALVIELLTGKPPYHFLDPMPALFRIVNDDSPPLPEGASAVVRDFLGQCFQKDGNLRVGARKLLRHPWMMAARKQVEEQEKERVGSRLAVGRPDGGRPRSGYDDGVLKVQEWNEAIKCAFCIDCFRRLRRADPPCPSANPTAPLASSQSHHPHPTTRLLRRPSVELASALALHPAPAPTSTAAPTPTSPKQLKSNAPALSPKRTKIPGDKPLPLSLMRPEVALASQGDREEEEEGDNWDGDFEEGISMSKIVAGAPPRFAACQTAG